MNKTPIRQFEQRTLIYFGEREFVERYASNIEEIPFEGSSEFLKTSIESENRAWDVISGFDDWPIPRDKGHRVGLPHGEVELEAGGVPSVTRFTCHGTCDGNIQICWWMKSLQPSWNATSLVERTLRSAVASIDVLATQYNRIGEFCRVNQLDDRLEEFGELTNVSLYEAIRLKFVGGHSFTEISRRMSIHPHCIPLLFAVAHGILEDCLAASEGNHTSPRYRDLDILPYAEFTAAHIARVEEFGAIARVILNEEALHCSHDLPNPGGEINRLAETLRRLSSSPIYFSSISELRQAASEHDDELRYVPIELEGIIKGSFRRHPADHTRPGHNDAAQWWRLLEFGIESAGALTVEWATTDEAFRPKTLYGNWTTNWEKAASPAPARLLGILSSPEKFIVLHVAIEAKDERN